MDEIRGISPERRSFRLTPLNVGDRVALLAAVVVFLVTLTEQVSRLLTGKSRLLHHVLFPLVACVGTRLTIGLWLRKRKGD